MHEKEVLFLYELCDVWWKIDRIQRCFPINLSLVTVVRALKLARSMLNQMFLIDLRLLPIQNFH